MASVELDSASKNRTTVDGGEGTGDGRQHQRRRVGLIYDERMCKHFAPDGIYRPENPSRIRAIWNKLHSAGITQRCVVLSAKEAEEKYIASVHTKDHIDLINNISSNGSDSQRDEIAAKFSAIYFNEGSSEAASLAVGSVIQVAEKVAKGELDSAFAIIRPPGHHAEEDEPKRFCLYNNVAVAACFLLDKRLHLGINKILVVDWDVHHGNGTQKMFWKDPRVLVFSVHRYGFGSFSPNNADCSHIMVGEGPGAGYNINVPWKNGQCGDADYLAAWDYVLIPVAKEFSPDMIIISAGFDAEISNSDSDAEDEDDPHMVPEDLEVADFDVEDDSEPHITSEDIGEAVQHVIQPLFFYDQGIYSSFSSRSELPKTYVWYAAYGSNMSKRRFNCYIEGGMVPGMLRPCIGSRDKSPPREISWMTLQHRLFFASDYTETWGHGGVAFLHPKQNTCFDAHICLYKITFEQFNDVLLQVNGYRSLKTVLDLTDRKYIAKKKSLILDLEHGRYHNIAYLLEKQGFPVLTITGTLSDIKKYRAKVLPALPLGKKYVNTLVEALVEGKQLSETKARAYINKASKPF